MLGGMKRDTRISNGDRKMIPYKTTDMIKRVSTAKKNLRIKYFNRDRITTYSLPLRLYCLVQITSKL